MAPPSAPPVSTSGPRRRLSLSALHLADRTVSHPSTEPSPKRQGFDSILAEETLQQLQRPRIVEGQRVAALRFADSTVQALWNAVLRYDLLPAGFSNRQLRAHLAQLLGQLEENLTQGRMSYQLRRLRLHGLIQRLLKTHRYRLTDFGLRTALFCTRSYARIFRRGVGMALPATSPVPNPLLRCFDKLQKEINAWVEESKMVP